MWAAVAAAYKKRPFLANSIGTAILASASDFVCQMGLERRSWDDYDIWRTGRFGFLGATVMSVMTPAWYRFSERVIVGGHPKILPLKKVLVHVFVYAPVNLALHVTLVRMLEGYSPSVALQMMTQKLPAVLSGYYKVYPAVQLMHYYLIPIIYRHPINQGSWLSRAILFAKLLREGIGKNSILNG